MALNFFHPFFVVLFLLKSACVCMYAYNWLNRFLHELKLHCKSLAVVLTFKCKMKNEVNVSEERERATFKTI